MLKYWNETDLPINLIDIYQPLHEQVDFIHAISLNQPFVLFVFLWY